MQTAPKVAGTFEILKEKIETKTAKVGIVGLGYVGLPLAVEFAKAGFTVTGIDVQESKVAGLNRGESYVQDVASEEVAKLISEERFAPPPISRWSAIWTRSTSACRRRCARPKIRT